MDVIYCLCQIDKKEGDNMELTSRQHQIIDIVKENQPITSENIAQELKLSRSALRNDLSLLTMMGYLEAKTNVGYFYSEKNITTELKKLLKGITVDKVMSVPVVLDEKVSVYDGIVTMFLEDVGTLFVVNEGYLSGVISRKDFLKSVIGSDDAHKTPLGVVMTRMPKIIVTYPMENVINAAGKMINHEVDSLPVVERVMIQGEEKYQILGRVSKTTVTRLFVELVSGTLGGLQ